ncbi:hypothetical protein [Streptosporangium sp. NPDC003464]
MIGRSEPVRIDGFSGITAAQLLNDVPQAICDLAANATDPLTSIRLGAPGGRMLVTNLKIYKDFPTM